MLKVTKMVLMLMLLIPSAVMGFAHGAEGTQQDGSDIIVRSKTTHCGPEKGESIHAALNGHCLMVSFSENLGEVAVAVETVSGSNVQCLSMLTPSGMQFYIPNAGSYIVTFTLADGTVYEGDFEVED